MKLKLWTLFFGFIQEIIIKVNCAETLHWMEWTHNPARFAYNGPPYINGTKMPDFSTTPDYRVEEPPFLAYHPFKKYSYYEMLRPIRISPHFKQTSKWTKHNWLRGNMDYPDKLGCYCTTVYKRLTLLAGCAVLTKRHILTTATSTELVLRKLDAKKKPMRLNNILGFWYDHNRNFYNSSIYMTPARIAYHPKYMYPHEVNITHPIPCVYDLAVWSTFTHLSYSACICDRGSSHWYEYAPSVPRTGEIMLIVGFQFVKAHKKRPAPWYKYVVRTSEIKPCPKTDWGWFSCLQGQIWGKYGLDSGAALHRALHRKRWVYDGLIGMNAFSMNLRSKAMIHYFMVINSHPVLDFLYDAYNGWMKYEYLHPDFWNSKGQAPVHKYDSKWWSSFSQPWGYEYYKGYDLPNY